MRVQPVMFRTYGTVKQHGPRSTNIMCLTAHWPTRVLSCLANQPIGGEIMPEKTEYVFGRPSGTKHSRSMRVRPVMGLGKKVCEGSENRVNDLSSPSPTRERGTLFSQ